MKFHTLDKLHENVPGDYYDQAIAHNIFQRYWHKRRFSETEKFLKNLKAAKILDIGCHGGKFTSQLSQWFPQASICGIDISSKAISFAQNKYPKIKFRVAKAEKMPFAASTFDLISCFEILEHVKDPKKVVLSIYKALKPNGTLVVLIPIENFLFKTIWFFWTRFGPGRIWKHTHLQHFQVDTFAAILNTVGFKIIQQKKFMLEMLSLIKAKKKST